MAVRGKGGSSSDEEAMLSQLAMALGSGGASTADAGRVYMGTSWNTPAGGPHGGSGLVAPERKGVDVWKTLEEAGADFYNWSTKKRRDFAAQLKVGGLLSADDGIVEAGAAWAKLVDEAGRYGAVGQKVTPWDILSSYVKGGKSPWVRQGDWEINSITGERRYVGPRFKTTTNQRIDLTDPETARAIATKVFQDLMGRDPGAGELKSFAGALGQAEEANPITEVTTTEYDMATGEAIGSKSKTSGGLTAEARARIGERQAKADPEYGAYQAATTYQNALESAVFGAPGS